MGYFAKHCRQLSQAAFPFLPGAAAIVALPGAKIRELLWTQGEQILIGNKEIGPFARLQTADFLLFFQRLGSVQRVASEGLIGTDRFLRAVKVHHAGHLQVRVQGLHRRIAGAADADPGLHQRFQAQPVNHFRREKLLVGMEKVLVHPGIARLHHHGEAAAFVQLQTVPVRELPVLQQLYEQYGQRVDFVCIGREETDTAVAAFWQKNHLTMPWTAQKDRKVYNLFAQTYIPRVYLADKIGLIQAMFVEKVDREELDKVLMKVVQQP